jgi:hypothetical protein
MKEREMAEKNCILEYPVGSILYGTNLPSSDTDFSGVFVASEDYYLGMLRVEEVDFSESCKLESGRNAPDAVDKKYFELRKFIKLAYDNNPNVLEQLFVPKESCTLNTPFGVLILDNRDLFPHKGLVDRFCGYAKGQLHKMHIKPENYDALKTFSEVEWGPDTMLGEHSRDGWAQHLIQFTEDSASIGDLHFNLKVKMKYVMEKVLNRLEKAGSRTELFLKHGYDVKFGMQCIRLLLEGIELLSTGTLVFPLKYRKELVGIRTGRLSEKELIEYATDLVADVEKARKLDVLPEKADFEQINKMQKCIVREFMMKCQEGA